MTDATTFAPTLPTIAPSAADALACHHGDVVQEELPNRLVPVGARRVLSAQRHAVRTATACDGRVVAQRDYDCFEAC
jgi:hypothetical protein